MAEKKQIPTNSEIVLILKEVLAAMEVKNVNIFRIRAYQNAISAIESLTQSVHDLWQNGRLKEIPGVGGALEAHLNDLFTKGYVKDFEEVKEGLPQGMFNLIGIRGIGAKKAFKLASAFNLTDRSKALEVLKTHAEEGDIAVLDGFGKKSEADILSSITEAKKHKREKPRTLLSNAEQVAFRVVTFLEESKLTEKVEVLGSFRRKEPTVGDLDIAVATEFPSELIEHFLSFPEIHDVISRGDKKASVVLTNELQIDLRVIDKASWGSMLQYFTGSKQHNVILRTYALENGYSLSEYGIKDTDGLHEFADEASFYNYIHLPYIPPTLRQGRDEVDMAKRGKLPHLVTLSDIRGDLHTHTTYSDGIDTLSDMVAYAKSLRYEYYGITDHAPSEQSRGEEEVLNIINTRRKEFEQLEDSLGNIKLLLGYEVNILADGTLGLSDTTLEKLDYAIASIHGAFNQPKDKITERLINAIKNPYINIIGHPSGRLINERPSYAVDWHAVFSACLEYNKVIEINSQPSRLDLPDDLVKEAIHMGIKLVITTDAHQREQLEYMRYGVYVAQRGWCSQSDILNTYGFDEFSKFINLRRHK